MALPPVICMVTDGSQRARHDVDALEARVRAAARAGVDLVQVREPALDGGALLQLVERCLVAVRSTRTRVVVNDRIDVALAAGAHGVHLRSDSVPASRVRAIAPPGFLVGRSVHGADEARRVTVNGGVDYLVFGTVFESQSKPGGTPAGVEALRAAVMATPVPVLAIGGITVERLSLVARSGAAGFAAIGLFAGSPEALQVSVSQAALAFDTPRGVP